MNVTNPIGVIEPAHVGQMFFDMVSEVMYQARGKTAHDWCMVAPPDLPGSFVKIYDMFIGPAFLKNVKFPDDYLDLIKDSEAVRDTMAMDGVRVLQAFFWVTAQGARVMQTRIKFDKTVGLSMFVGFCREAKAHVMPHGAGLSLEHGQLSFNGKSVPVADGGTLLLRIEMHNRNCGVFMNDELLGTEPTEIYTSPVIALFNKNRGSRKVAPGYEHALKRTLA